MANPPARSAEERKRDTLHRLEHDVDLWVASADPETAAPFLVPLSFAWDGTDLLFATTVVSPTGRNLGASGQARIGLGPTRDVVMIDGPVRAHTAEELSEETHAWFAESSGWDPRQQTNSADYRWFRLTPRRIQAWRESNELKGRDLMRDGKWLV
ncbi:pyridoxamine 5'-phosphate oxidase family protein [Streptomyces sp. TRM66268-LWL]|uniref:Pyridoxamine 5'-phosphate oxidase family protein n=1 Tax=Streptomyces polyasparticus TaxID=2767826 RepID=A0ABR7SI63_9ACTN|nr:pyridoxamine 5'-phosphate oxidase family protein [Streptomyces polyasparticus]MBC9713998.1 pyridoxamine 5'-phosphate oxidase family protein [Streptomyces polyasparticus]